MTDWKHLLDKYMNIVGYNEGVDFLYPAEWTKEEWAALATLDATQPPMRSEPLPEWSPV